MANFDVLTKGKLPREEGFPVQTRRYLILDSTPRRVSIEFVNKNCHEVTGLRFLLRQLDDKNSLLVEQKVEILGLLSGSGSKFRIDRTVDFACVRVEIEIQSVIYGEYEYINDGHVRVNYLSEPVKSKEFIKAPVYAVSLKSKKLARLTYLFVSVVFAIALATVALCGVFDSPKTEEPSEQVPEPEFSYERVYVEQ